MNYSQKVEAELEKNKDVMSSNSGEWFRFREGLNIIRLLAEPAVLFEDFKMGMCYHDCGFTGSPKFLTYVLDKADNKVKTFKIPNTINDAIIGFEKSSRFSFSGFPMPYDLEISAVNAGTKEVKYTVMPGVESTVDVGDKLPKKTPAEVVEILKEKNKEKHEADGTRAKILAEREHNIKGFNEAVERAKDRTDLPDVEDIEYPEVEDNEVAF